MKVLITGATGAIGLEILNQLNDLKRLRDVTILVRKSKKNDKALARFNGDLNICYGDITDANSLVPACKNQDVVFHLAGIIPPLAEDNIALGRNVNVQGTRNLIQCLEEHSPNAHLFFSSSVVVYGDRLQSPEIYSTDPLEYEHNDEYGKAKIEAEKHIQESKLKWTIYRLTAIMGIGNHKVSGIMFKVPLATPMEIASVRDTATAFINSLEHTSEVEHKIYNLSGGEQCRISYEEFMTKAFKSYGMGKVNFPKYAFARQNFHCGYLMDGDDLDDILHFRSDDIESYFNRFHASVPVWQRALTRPFAGIAKWYLATLSEPLKAYKSKDQEQIRFFFGNIDE